LSEGFRKVLGSCVCHPKWVYVEVSLKLIAKRGFAPHRMPFHSMGLVKLLSDVHYFLVSWDASYERRVLAPWNILVGVG
jgi:hypothetical protein